jgi:hypothetical protein
MNCPECRAYFEARRSDQTYCSAACNRVGGARELARARRVYRALYHWRLGHKTFGANMRFVCREVAAWIREDRERQRLPPPPHDHDSDRGHERAPQAVSLAAPRARSKQ